MKATRIIPVAMLIVAGGLALHAALAQQQGVQRTELQRYDLSVPGREVIQVRVDLDPGSDVPPALTSRRGDHLCARRRVGVSGRRQGSDEAQGRRSLVHPGWSEAWGVERRQWQGLGARNVYRRKREAAG